MQKFPSILPALLIPGTLLIPKAISRSYLGTPKPFEMTDVTYTAPDYQGIPDLDAAWDGSTLFLAHHDGYGLFRPVGEPGRPRLEATELGSIPRCERGPAYAGLKWRRGHFFARVGRNIRILDSATGIWRDHFISNRLFSQFEILADGHILLICPTSRPPMTSSGAVNLEMNLNKGPEIAVLAEVYDPARPGKPERVYSYPARVEEALGKMNAFPLVDQTFPLGDHILLVNARAGHLHVFDVRTRSLESLEVPWPQVDGPYLKSLDSTPGRGAAPAGVMKISCLSFPWKILVYPQASGGALIAVMRHSGIDSAFVEERRRQERSLGCRYAPVARIYSEAEKEAWAWMEYYLLDPRTGKLSRLRPPALGALRADPAKHWLMPEGDCVPLKDLGLPGPGNP